MAEEIVVGKDALLRKFRSLSEVAQGMTLARTVQVGAMPIVNGAKQNIKDEELIRTRQLSRSIHAEISMRGPAVAEAEIGTDLEYGPIHEFGGTIRPKSAKYLAIPVGTYKGSPLKHPRLKIRITNAGNLVMVDSMGRVQYVLKTSVEIPARPYMRPAFDEKKQDAIDDMGRAFARLVTKAAAEG